MHKYYHLIKTLLEHFENYVLIHVDREKNDRADALVHLAKTKKTGQHRTFIQETLKAPHTGIVQILFDQVVQSGWMMSPIWTYLINNILHSEEMEALKVKLKAFHYSIINNEMSRRGIARPLLNCIS